MGNKDRRNALREAAIKAGVAAAPPKAEISPLAGDETSREAREILAQKANEKGDALLEQMNKEAEAKVAAPLEQPKPAAHTAPPTESTAGALVTAASAAVSTSSTKLANRLRASLISSPVKAVWEIADIMKKQNPNVRRKDVVAACISHGIATYTALTQYQLWFTAHKADPKPEAAPIVVQPIVPAVG